MIRHQILLALNSARITRNVKIKKPFVYIEKDITFFTGPTLL